MPPVSLPPSPPPHQPSPPWTSLASRRIHPPPWSSSPPLDRFQSDRALVPEGLSPGSLAPDPSAADAYYNFPSPPPHQLHADYGSQYLPLEGTNALGLASDYTAFLPTDNVAGDINPLASGSEVPSPLTSLPPTVPLLGPCPLPPHATQMMISPNYAYAHPDLVPCNTFSANAFAAVPLTVSFDASSYNIPRAVPAVTFNTSMTAGYNPSLASPNTPTDGPFFASPVPYYPAPPISGLFHGIEQPDQHATGLLQQLGQARSPLEAGLVIAAHDYATFEQGWAFGVAESERKVGGALQPMNAFVAPSGVFDADKHSAVLAPYQPYP